VRERGLGGAFAANIVILDNLGSHKGKAIRAAIAAAGALLDCSSPKECQAYLANAGYGATNSYGLALI
jgi:hypothetical protein